MRKNLLFKLFSDQKNKTLIFKWVESIKKSIIKPITIILSILLLSCSMGTSFRLNEIKSFKGTTILSSL